MAPRPLPDMSQGHETGIWGENWVRERYARLGYTIICQRYRTPRFELDLLLQKQSLLVAVEVKTRRLTHFLPDAIPWSIQQRSRAWWGLKSLAMKNHDIKEFRLDFSAVYYSKCQRVMRVQQGGVGRKFECREAAFGANLPSMMQNPRQI